jgi:hypothetical protein
MLTMTKLVNSFTKIGKAAGSGGGKGGDCGLSKVFDFGRGYKKWIGGPSTQKSGINFAFSILFIVVG